MHNLEIERNYTYHQPHPGQVDRYNQLRTTGKALALQINALVPESREKALALTTLEQAIMWANAAIARGESGMPVDDRPHGYGEVASGPPLGRPYEDKRAEGKRLY